MLILEQTGTRAYFEAMRFTAIAARGALLLLLISIASSGGCADFGRPAAHLDLSTPKSAALEYLRAVQRGDARTAHAASVGADTERGWVDGLVTLVAGMRQFDDALYQKFGKGINQAHVDLHDSLDALADEPVRVIEEGSVVSEGNAARVDPMRKGFTAHFQPSIWLLHEKEGWKVDLRKTYAPDVPAEKLPEVTASFRRYREAGDAFQQTARDVRAGLFRTTADAERALAQRTQANAR